MIMMVGGTIKCPKRQSPLPRSFAVIHRFTQNTQILKYSIYCSVQVTHCNPM